MKLLLGFSEYSALCPTLLIDGNCFEDSTALSQLHFEENDASITLILSVDWGRWRTHELIRELRSVGSFAIEAAVAALSPDMPLVAREWGVSHLQSLGKTAAPAIQRCERISNALAGMLASEAAHWLRHAAVEAIRDMGLAYSCMRVLADCFCRSQSGSATALHRRSW